MIDKILEEILLEKSKEQEVAVLLSGGVDSISIACCANRLNKKVHAYSFHLKDQPSYDSDKAKQVCEIFGWNFTLIEVPIDNLKRDFLTLKHDYFCLKKTQYECTFPFLYVYPHIKEKDILSGLGADSLYGVSKKAMMHYKEPKSKFDEFRIDAIAKRPGGYNQQLMLCETYNKNFVTPYMDSRVIQYFMQFDWYEINKPFQKHHVRTAFKEEFDKIGRIKQHSNLQLESGIDHAFEILLNDSSINFKRRSRMLELYKDHC